MNSLSQFLKDFLRNRGQDVFGSLLVGKICAFISSLIIIKLLPQEEFGLLSVVASVFAIFLPFNGFGSQQALLRYGSLEDDVTKKSELSAYLFKHGMRYQILVTIFFILASLFTLEKTNVIYLVAAFAVRMIGFYFYLHLQSYYRIVNDNRTFAIINNYVNVIGLVLVLLFTYFFGFFGYLFAVAVSPFISLFWYKAGTSGDFKNISFSKKELFGYGTYAAATSLLSDTLFSLDILLLGFLMNETAVANYKVAILIPANITFLALVFMQADFPIIAKKHMDKSFLKNYINNYYKLFIPICVIIFLSGFFLKKYIFHFLFGEKYSGNEIYFTILLAAFCLNMLFRNLYGNLLSAVGKIRTNTIVSLISLPILVALSFFMVPIWGVFGMVISISCTLIFTGLFFAISFLAYFRTLK